MRWAHLLPEQGTEDTSKNGHPNTQPNLRELRALFDSKDSLKTGSISAVAAAQLWEGAYGQQHAKSAAKQELSFKDFVDFMTDDYHMIENLDAIKVTFDQLDSAGSGLVTKGSTESAIAKFGASVPETWGELVSFDEFAVAVQHSNSTTVQTSQPSTTATPTVTATATATATPTPTPALTASTNNQIGTTETHTSSNNSSSNNNNHADTNTMNEFSETRTTNQTSILHTNSPAQSYVFETTNISAINHMSNNSFDSNGMNATHLSTNSLDSNHSTNHVLGNHVAETAANNHPNSNSTTTTTTTVTTTTKMFSAPPKSTALRLPSTEANAAWTSTTGDESAPTTTQKTATTFEVPRLAQKLETLKGSNNASEILEGMSVETINRLRASFEKLKGHHNGKVPIGSCCEFLKIDQSTVLEEIFVTEPGLLNFEEFVFACKHSGHTEELFGQAVQLQNPVNTARNIQLESARLSNEMTRTIDGKQNKLLGLREDRIASLKKQLEHLREMLSATNERINFLQTNVTKTLQSSKDHKSQNIPRLSAQLQQYHREEALTRESAIVTAACARETEDRVVQLEQEVESNLAQKKRLESRIQMLEAELSQTQEECERLQQEHLSRQEADGLDLAKLATLRDQLEHQVQVLNVEKQGVSEKRKQLVLNTNEISLLRQQSIAKINQTSSKLGMVTTSIATLRPMTETAEGEVERRAREVVELRQSFRESISKTVLLNYQAHATRFYLQSLIKSNALATLVARALPRAVACLQLHAKIAACNTKHTQATITASALTAKIEATKDQIKTEETQRIELRSGIDEATTQIVVSRKTHTSLQQRLDHCASTMITLQEEEDKLLEQRRRITEDTEKAKARSEQAHVEVVTYTQELTTLTKTVAELQTKITAMESQREMQLAAADSSEEQRVAAQSAVTRARAEMSALKVKIETTSAKLEETRQQHAKLHGTETSAAAELEKTSTRVAELESRVAELEQQTNGTTELCASHEAELVAQQDSSKRQVEEVQGKLESSEAARDELKSQIKALKAQVSAHTKTLGQLTGAVEHQMATNQALEESLVDKAAVEAEWHRTETEATQVKHLLEDLARTLEQKYNLGHHLKAAIQQQDAELLELRGRISILHSEIEQAKEQDLAWDIEVDVVLLRDSNAELKRKLAAVAEENKHMKTTATQTTRTISRLRDEVTKLEDAASAFVDQMYVYHMELADKKAQLKRLRGQQNRLDQKVTKEQILELEQQVEEHNVLVRKARANFTSVTTQVQTIQQRLHSVDGDVSQLHGAVEALQTENAALASQKLELENELELILSKAQLTRRDLARISRTHATLATQAKALEDERTTIQNERRTFLEGVVRVHETKEQRLREEFEMRRKQMTEEIQNLSVRLETLLVENGSMQDKLEAVRSEHHRINKQNGTLMEEVVKAERQVRSRTAQRQEYEKMIPKDVQDMRTEHDKVTKENSNLETDLARLKGKISATLNLPITETLEGTGLTRAEKEYRDSKRTRTKLDAKLTAANEQLTATVEQLGRGEETSRKAQRKFQSAQRQIEEVYVLWQQLAGQQPVNGLDAEGILRHFSTSSSRIGSVISRSKQESQSGSQSRRPSSRPSLPRLNLPSTHT